VIVRVGMAPRAAELSYEAFQEHWRSEHAGLAGEIEGLRRYVQNHAVLRDGRPLLPYAGFDACSEIEFDSLEAMDAGFASEYYRRAVVADERSLIDKPRFFGLLAERRVLAGERAVPADAVKLLTFLLPDPRSSREALVELLAGPYRELVAEARPLRHEQLLEIPGAHEGRIPKVFAAIDLVWLPDEAAALELATGELGHRAGYLLAGTAVAPARLVAREVTVKG
jgi:uncharacterized protein (TIGR02118 family)